MDSLVRITLIGFIVCCLVFLPVGLVYTQTQNNSNQTIGGNLTVNGAFSLNGSGKAGAIELGQGTAPALGTNSVILYGDTAITSYKLRMPAAAGTGLMGFTNTSNDVVASFPTFALNAPLIGGGAGVIPTTGTRSGNTTVFGTTSGTLTSGNCLKSDANGNIIDAGGLCQVLQNITNPSSDTLDCNTTANITTQIVDFANGITTPAFTQSVGAEIELTYILKAVTSSTSPTFTWAVDLDGTTVYTSVSTLSGPNSITDATIIWRFLLVLTATGSSGTIRAGHLTNTASGTLQAYNSTGAVTSFNTTTTHTAKLGLKCGASTAGNNWTFISGNAVVRY
jgi:hypothetical protein